MGSANKDNGGENVLPPLPPKLKKKQVRQKYGVIKTSILTYITPTMITVFVTCALVVSLNFERVVENYNTNIPLNSLILLIFFMASGKAFLNNVYILHAARFFKKVENLMQEPVVTDEDIDKLKHMLETKAYLVNTQNTFKLLSHMVKYGQPLISDNDARIIKSKLGFRIRAQRSSVSFMAGLLVMLGLIGTFWGLLLTIGAVGAAMDMIAVQTESLGGESGGIGGIISAISEPLQGMGLAFSTSLFGLAGSLVVGFFNYACGQAQDIAIEDFSRWIDENIPLADTPEAILLKNEEKMELMTEGDVVEEGAPVKDALSAAEKPTRVSGGGAPQQSFMPTDSYAAIWDENMTSQILHSMKRSQETNEKLHENFNTLLVVQGRILEALESEGKDIGKIKDVQNEFVKENLNLQKAIFQEIRGTNTLNEQIVDKTAGILDVNTKAHSELVKEHSNIKGGFADLSKMLKTSNQHFESFQKGFNTSIENDNRLIREVSAMKDKIPKNEYENIQASCNEIVLQIKMMDKTLEENAKIMRDVAKEGNMQRMARILKEMQVFWLQMRQSSFFKSKDNA